MAAGPSFADVPAVHWAYAHIEAIYAAGLTSGCVPNARPALRLYCPSDTVDRAQMAVFLVRGIYGANFVPPPPTGIFPDVPVTHWAAAYIEQLFNDGITSGCGGGLYCPDAPVTRDSVAVLLLRAKHGASYTPPPATGTVFTDVPADYWAAAWIEQLALEGITSGCAPGLYCPTAAVTRDSAAVLLTRTFNLPLP